MGPDSIIQAEAQLGKLSQTDIQQLFANAPLFNATHNSTDDAVPQTPALPSAHAANGSPATSGTGHLWNALPELEQEIAFLLRHFSETLAPWMDLYHSRAFYEHTAPYKALHNTLIRDAIAAVAAKQLSRLNSQASSRRPEMDRTWRYKAAEYYDKAIVCSRIHVEALSGTSTAMQSERLLPDELTLAVSILSVYEYLDNAASGWER